jgi:TM2 domain-containing membrane protein YozV
MNLPATQPPRCRSCQAILQPPGHVCSKCNTVQQLPQQMTIRVSAPPKSVGVAVLLSFIWLGAGHIYAGKTGLGIALAVLDGILVLLALTGIGMIVAFPVWIIAAPVTMALSASAVNSANRRGGGGVTIS